MPEFEINAFWVVLVAIPSLFATINAVLRWRKDARESGNIDNIQNQEIALIKQEQSIIRSDLNVLKNKVDKQDGRITQEIKELEKKIDGRFDQVINLITQIK